MDTVRTRFAPSPTGYLHVGGIRTALFAWLVARQNGGVFVLRFEDTDKKREVAGSREHLIKSLRALGLDYDEGPDIGGPYGPYTQSERMESYHRWAQKLIASGRAYADVRTPDELDALRADAASQKKPFLARNYRPENPPAWQSGMPLRFLSEPKAYQWHDEVMGSLSAGEEAVDDFILVKSDGLPTYNFAHVVDDAEMAITHIIRGQEFIASQPNYLNLYEALGVERPLIATVPHILGPDGNKKLSKRDGAKDVLDYIRDGFLPEALVNFIASLGWNDGTEQEVFSREELIEKFSLDRVQRSGARFDENRLTWMNGSWIRSLSLSDLYERTTQPTDFWPAAAAGFPEDYRKQVLDLAQERLKYFAELPQLTNYFFEDLPLNPELITHDKQLKKFEPGELKELLQTVRGSLAQSDFTATDLTERLNALLTQTGLKPAVVFGLTRVAATQAPFSPPLADMLTVLGKETALRRIDQQLAAL